MAKLKFIDGIAVNSVAALRQDLIKYFKDPNDAFCITTGSSKRVSLICPDCGTEKTMIMYNLFKKRILL